jgi:hypothetical protein
MPVSSGNVALGQPSSALAIIFLATIFICSSLACSKSPEAAKTPEVEPHAITAISPLPSPFAIAQATATPEQREKTPPPKADEVVEAMARVFNQAASLDDAHAPSFVVGDFNGDGSEDLAIVTKANENSLAEINSDLANWTLEDPKVVPIPGTKAAEKLVRPKSVKVQKTDSLLAILHGVGPQGWRNRDARQTFLLRNGAGANILVRSAGDLRSNSATFKLPPLKGEAISETMNGRNGLLFWTGARYAWYPTGN